MSNRLGFASVGTDSFKGKRMKFNAAIAGAIIAAGTFAATAVIAQQDPIAARKALMKLNNDHARTTTAMVRGTAPFDAKQVKAAFDQWADTASKFGALFPDGSQQGDTRAAPAIWTERAKFDAAIAKFGKDVADNSAKATGDLEGLKAAMSVVGQNCGSCHETFRVSR